ncbi:MAG: phosphoribosylformylglycinamidine synthase, partial [Clostridiales bacterium]|nr:phosphoribosylformylglycinamidine synthase [Clostridiales bacterium]
FNPYISEKGPYIGAYLAVVESVAKLVAAGATWRNAHLTLQEYFERMTGEPEKWGRPMAALLGALAAQLDLGVAAIGGKDSMSGSFEDMRVPPTLVSFAISTCAADRVIGNAFKRAGAKVGLLCPETLENGLPEPESLRALFDELAEKIRSGEIVSAQAITSGGVAEAVFKMGLGNRIGFKFSHRAKNLFARRPGGFVVEYRDGAEVKSPLGTTTELYEIALKGEIVSSDELEELYDGRLEGVFPTRASAPGKRPPKFVYGIQDHPRSSVRATRPRVLIPVFPGTNCEYDTGRAFRLAGAEPEIVVVRNLTASDVQRSVEEFAKKLSRAQIAFIPGGFSGGDEPDGSGKFITAFFRSPAILDAVSELLNVRDGLIGGVCNGFQALIKLGLLPYGEIREPDPGAPTLTFNRIGRHQSRIVRTRVASNLSPWLMRAKVGDIHSAPISHGEGRFIASEPMIRMLADGGQIATQYVDDNGAPTMDIDFNPSGSTAAIEGITSPDGRVFGRMAHSERVGKHLYRNVPGDYESGIFRSAVDYFQ